MTQRRLFYLIILICFTTNCYSQTLILKGGGLLGYEILSSKTLISKGGQLGFETVSKNNGYFDYGLDLGADYTLAKKITIGVNYEYTYYKHWTDNVDFIWSISTNIFRPEFRYYFKESFKGLFIGANVSYNKSVTKLSPAFNIQIFHDQTYKIGLPIGFQYKLTDKFGLEAKLNYIFFTTRSNFYNGLWKNTSLDFYLNLVYALK